MLATGFVLAMRGRLAIAAYETPHQPRRLSSGWLIVGRWGLEGRFLSLSWAGVATRRRQGAAPPDLSPRLTCIGLLTADPAGGAARNFVLARCPPPGMAVAGRFLPCDGFVRLGVVGGGAMRLGAAGRYTLGHRRAAWGLAAEPVPWIGDLTQA